MVSVTFLIITKSAPLGLPSLQKAKNENGNQHLAITSNENFLGEKSHFQFSPDRKYIAFVQNAFEEYGHDWDRYWALKLFLPESGSEKTLFVDDTKMSSYEWLDSRAIRVYHDAGTGVRAYKDIAINRKAPLFFKDYKRLEGGSFWIPDEEYAREVEDAEEARLLYSELSAKQ